jgi:lysyl-tRNA synthetase class 2
MTPPEDWRPGASVALLRLRAEMLAATRAFFAERGLLEVETPALSAAASTSPALQSFQVRDADGGLAGYLHTSPEFPMKRLLAAGCGSIYQICRAFRAGELGRWHNPELTLVEWYRVGMDHHALMVEVAELLVTLLPPERLSRPREVLSYQEVFRRALAVDPLQAPLAVLEAAARRAGIVAPAGLGEHRDTWLDLLLSHAVQPGLGRGGLTFVHGFPASQAALARLDPDDPRVAHRFEVFLEGVELANGFHELADPAAQRARFEAELRQRAESGLPPVPVDQRLLTALEQGGLPECAGVALGFDRVVGLAAGATNLDQVMAFSARRA